MGTVEELTKRAEACDRLANSFREKAHEAVDNVEDWDSFMRLVRSFEDKASAFREAVAIIIKNS